MSEIHQEANGHFSLVAEDTANDVAREAYRVLGTSIGVTGEELRAAYRQQISQYHPDKVAVLGPELRALAEEKTKEINRAYSLLVNRVITATRRNSTTVRFSQGPSAEAVGPTARPDDNTAVILSIFAVGLVAIVVVVGLIEGESPTSPVPPTSMAAPEVVKPQLQILKVEPWCDDSQIVRPKSGSELGGRHRGGLGRLTIDNGTDNGAVAVLVDDIARVAKRAIYVRGHEAGSITSVPPGTYRIQFQLGNSWLRQRRFWSAWFDVRHSRAVSSLHRRSQPYSVNSPRAA